MSISSLPRSSAPAHSNPWEARAVEDIGDVVGGSTPSRAVPAYWDGDIPWVTPGDITSLDSKFLSHTRDRITAAGLASCGARLLPPGTLLVTSRATLGAVAIAACAVATNQGFKSIVCGSDTDPNFYYHLFKRGVPDLPRKASGTTFLEISAREFARIHLPCPPLAEQRRIATILDTLDEAIRGTQEVIGKLGQMSRGLVHDLMSRGIDENGIARTESQQRESFVASPVGPIPATWRVQPLGSLARRVTDGTHQAVTVTPSSNSGVPFLYVSCIRDGQVKWDSAARIARQTYDVISKGREPESGMILYTAVGSYGHAALVDVDHPFAFQRHIACIYPDNRIVESSFLAYWLDSPAVKHYADTVALGNAQLTVTLGELAAYPIPVPPLSEQREIARQLRLLTEQRAAETLMLRKLVMIRAGLASDLLTGAICLGAERAEALS